MWTRWRRSLKRRRTEPKSLNVAACGLPPAKRASSVVSSHQPPCHAAILKGGSKPKSFPALNTASNMSALDLLALRREYVETKLSNRKGILADNASWGITIISRFCTENKQIQLLITMLSPGAYKNLFKGSVAEHSFGAKLLALLPENACICWGLLATPSRRRIAIGYVRIPAARHVDFWP